MNEIISVEFGKSGGIIFVNGEEATTDPYTEKKLPMFGVSIEELLK